MKRLLRAAAHRPGEGITQWAVVLLAVVIGCTLVLGLAVAGGVGLLVILDQMEPSTPCDPYCLPWTG